MNARLKMLLKHWLFITRLCYALLAFAFFFKPVMFICDAQPCCYSYGDVTSSTVVWCEQVTAYHSHPEDGHATEKRNVGTSLLREWTWTHLRPDFSLKRKNKKLKKKNTKILNELWLLDSTAEAGPSKAAEEVEQGDKCRTGWHSCASQASCWPTSYASLLNHFLTLQAEWPLAVWLQHRHSTLTFKIRKVIFGWNYMTPNMNVVEFKENNCCVP